MKNKPKSGKPISRRKFTTLSIKGMTGVLAIPFILPDSRWKGANDRLNIGHIGVGDRGGWELKNYFLPLSDSYSVAISDVHLDRRESWTQQVKQFYREKKWKGPECQSYLDFEEILQRKDIDAVHITTPDHWHVPAAIRAARAGKHIMLAKPLGLSYPNYLLLRNEIANHDVRFHYGTQQRTYEHMHAGVDMIREGKIGDIQKVSVWCPGKNPVNSPECKEVPVPDGFDFDRWTGPAPLNTYCPDRVTNNSSWFQYDYSIGFLAGWGAHPLDVLVWALKDQVGKIYHCNGTGKFWSEGGIYDNIYSWDVKYHYENGLEVHFVSMDVAEEVISHRDEKESNGTTFYGTKGWISLSRNSVQSNIPEIHSQLISLIRENNTMAQVFMDIIHEKQKEICPLEEAIISDTLSHMGDIAIRTKSQVTWDPQKGKVINNREGDQLYIRKMREPYRL